MGIMSEIDALANEYIRNSFDIDWDRFNDIHRAALYELYVGPLGTDYWDHVDPLDYYEWISFNKALEDLWDIIKNLPTYIYYNILDESFLQDYDHLELFEDDYLLEISVKEMIVNYELVRYI
jgi:hypothetical protein